MALLHPSNDREVIIGTSISSNSNSSSDSSNGICNNINLQTSVNESNRAFLISAATTSTVTTTVTSTAVAVTVAVTVAVPVTVAGAAAPGNKFSDVKLVLAGSTRNAEDAALVAALRNEVADLGLEDHVEFKVLLG